MITTVSLNTSLDHMYYMDNFHVGEVNRVKKCIKTPGGKGLNVARVVKLCGEEVLCTGVIGGYKGKEIISMLDNTNLHHRFVQTSKESRSCINIIDQNNVSTEILEPGEDLSAEDICEFRKTFREQLNMSSVITLSGSVPGNVPDTIYQDLIHEVRRQGKQVILDTSGKLLQEGIKAKPTIVKPNQDEIEAFIGRKVTSIEDAVLAAQKIKEIGIELVVISLGEKGAVFVTDRASYHAIPPKMNPINTVGSGDSMVAALAVSIVRKYDVETMIRYAISISAANTLSIKTAHFQEEDRKRIYEQVNVEKLGS